MFNRVLILILLNLVFIHLSAFSAHASFEDVPIDHWAYEAVMFLEDKGLITGYPDGTFKGDIGLSRHEFALVIFRLHNQIVGMVNDAMQSEPPIDVQLVLDGLMSEFKPEIEELMSLVIENTERIENLEGGYTDFDSRLTDLADLINSMEDPIRLYGDMRVRFDGRYPDTGLRSQRAIYRFRVGFTTEINEELVLGARFATGPRDSITSANEIIDDAFATDNLDVDTAYLRYLPSWARGFTFWAGKFRPPWKQTPMVWDSDVTVEGIAQHFNYEKFNLYLGELVPTEEGFYLVAQVGMDDLLIDGLDAYATWHYINEEAWQHIRDQMQYGILKSRWEFDHLESPDEYRAIEGYIRWAGSVDSLPVSVEANYLRNLEGTNPMVEGSGWQQAAWLRLSLNGSPSLVGDWRLRGEWGRIQANSVLSWLTDSTRGSGDNEFQGFEFAYRILPNTDLVILYLNLDRISRDIGSTDIITIDVNTKF
jgi:hypothetical protein